MLEISQAHAGATRPITVAAADRTPIYINEDAHGRQVTITYVPPAVPVPRDGTATAAVASGTFRVTGDEQNIGVATNLHTGAAVRARPMPITQSGSSITFELSGCGLDLFTIEFTPTPVAGGTAPTESIMLEVRKRLTATYAEMSRATGGGSLSLTNFAGSDVLSDALAIFADDFGIDIDITNLTAPLAGTHHAHVSESQIDSTLHEAPIGMPSASSARPPRQLWILAADRLRDGVIGLGGSGALLIACGSLEEELATFRQIVAGYETWGRQAHHEPFRPHTRFGLDTFVHEYLGLLGTLTHEDFVLYSALLTRIEPEDLVKAMLKTTIVHEMGHVLGLVPSDERAAAAAQFGWRDAAHANHCADRLCMMYWENEDSGRIARDRLEAPQAATLTSFRGEPGSNCWLYLTGADLSDIRALPT